MKIKMNAADVHIWHDRCIQGIIMGSVIVAVRVCDDRMELVWLECQREWCGDSCPVLPERMLDLWHALDIMLTRLPGIWVYTRVLWCGLQEILEIAPDSLSGLWKRKSVVEVSIFPSDVLTEGLRNWDVARQS